MSEAKIKTIITPRKRWFDFRLGELFRYRDLVTLFVRRTFVSQYKQTILGPAWAIIQPLLTTIMFTVVFGNIAKLPTDGMPPFLFYMCGNIAWGYFAHCLSQTSNTFISNAYIFGKVYFPRMVIPVSTVISSIISFAIQFLLFLAFLLYFLLRPNNVIAPNVHMMLLPLLVLQMALLGLGFGIIVAAVTTKYRDLHMLVAFGVQLWMYATPVAYSSSMIPAKYVSLYRLNPMTPIIETFRYAFLGSGSFRLEYFLTGWGVTLLLLLLGLMLFSHVEKTFMDTV